MKNSEIEHFTSQTEHWVYENDTLVGSYQFSSFAQLQVAVSHLMQLAAELNHHPTVTFGYNTLHIELQTHDAGNAVTEKDLQFAQQISAIIEV